MVTIYWSNPQEKEAKCTSRRRVQITRMKWNVFKATQLKVIACDEMCVAQLEKELAKHKSGPLLISCRLNFTSQRDVTMVEDGLSRIHPLRYLSCIPVHKHKSSLPKFSCYHQWKPSIAVSRNSTCIQVLIKLSWTLSKL